MTTRVHAVFDGEALLPDEPVDLQVNERYVLTIQQAAESHDGCAVEEGPAFDLSSLGVRTGIPDLATQHDHYLYGRPKRFLSS